MIIVACLRLARSNGFDDALLTASDGLVSESGIANIGFLDASGVVWPDAPLLHGITMQRLERTLPEVGVTSRRAPVRLQDITSLEGAFLSNARGIAAVTQVDDATLPMQAERMKTIDDAYTSVPWDTIYAKPRASSLASLGIPPREAPRRSGPHGSSATRRI